MNIFVTLYWGSVDGVFEIEESGCLESEMNGRRERPEYFCCWQRKGGEWAHAEETSGCRQLFRANRLLSSVMTCYWIPELHNGPVVVSQSAHWTLLRFIKEMIIFTWSNHQRSIIKTDLPSWICNVMVVSEVNDCDMELDCDVYHKDVTVEFAGLDSNCTVRTSLLLIFFCFVFTSIYSSTFPQQFITYVWLIAAWSDIWEQLQSSRSSTSSFLFRPYLKISTQAIDFIPFIFFSKRRECCDRKNWATLKWFISWIVSNILCVCVCY